MRARHSPRWVQNAIIYELYFRSFSREGTIKSAIKHLSSLRSLGVNILWLMPIHPIGFLGRKGSCGSPYAVKNYYSVNPDYGSFDDLKKFIIAAHKFGFRVIMDLVIGHSAWDNPLLIIHPEWFKKKHGEIISPLPEWSDVAAFDYRKKELWRYMLRMMKFWIAEIGFDGFRCDVANNIPLKFWEEARNTLDTIKPTLMISETDNNPSHHLRAFDLSYSTHLYNTLVSVLKNISPAKKIIHELNHKQKHYPKGSLLLRFTSNHDINSTEGSDVTVFGRKGAMLAAVFINTITGVPMLYNGQEDGSTQRLSLFDRTILRHQRFKKNFQFYQKIFTLRKIHSAFTQGKIIELPSSQPESAVVFARTNKNETIIVMLNFSNKILKLSIDFKSLHSHSTIGIPCYDFIKKKRCKVHLDGKKIGTFVLSGRGWNIIRWNT